MLLHNYHGSTYHPLPGKNITTVESGDLLKLLAEDGGTQSQITYRFRFAPLEKGLKLF